MSLSAISDRVSPFDALDAKLLIEKREQHKARVREQAKTQVQAMLCAHGAADQGLAARALAEAALAEVARLFDPARAQAILGKISRGFGGELSAPRSDVRRAAERLFNTRQTEVSRRARRP